MQKRGMFFLTLAVMNYIMLFSMVFGQEDINIKIQNRLPVTLLVTITDRSNEHEFRFFEKHGRCEPECASSTYNKQSWWKLAPQGKLSFTLTEDVLNSDVFEDIQFPIYLKFAADLGATIIKQGRKPVEKGDVINLDIGSQGKELYITEK